MKTDYRIDDFQQTYWVIDSFEELLEATYQDFGPIYDALEADKSVYPVDAVFEGDHVHNHGTQAYAKAGGRLAKAAS